MDSYVLTLYDDAGNPIPIPAIQGIGIKNIRREGEVLEIELDDGRVFAFAVGDGSAVSTDAELYAAASAGGVITIAPDADITVSQTLDLPAGTVILGNGATIRRAAGFEEGMFNLSSDCRLENFTIDGNRSAMVKPTWDKTYEVNMKTDAQGCVVENITINNGNEGIIVSGYDNIVRGCKLYDLGGNGIHFGAAYRCIAEDCTVIGANKNASVMGNSRGCIYTCMYVEDVDIVNCYCEDGLAGVGGVDAPDNAHIKIIGCTAKNCTAAIEGTYVPEGGPVDVVISDNQFIDCGDIELLNRGHKYPPGDGLVISGNLFTNAGIHLHGFLNVTITGNTVRGGWIRADECPYCLISGNVVDCLNDAGIYVRYSSNASISGNSVRNKGILVYASYCPRLLISGNTLRQKSGSTTTAECIKLNYSPEAAIDNNKMFLYSGNGIMLESNCRTMGNYIIVADSSQIAIRVWGGNKNYVVAQNMSNGTYAIATGTNSVIQNNITIESTAFVDVVYTLTNITTDGFAKALTDDDFEFTLTAADGYSLPDAITVTMGGTVLAAGTGYAYDNTSGKVTVYRVSGAVEVTAGGV